MLPRDRNNGRNRFFIPILRNPIHFISKSLFGGTILMTLLVSVWSETNGQDKLESLLHKLSTTDDDTVKAYLFGALARQYFLTRDQLDLALDYTDSMILLSKQLDFHEGIAKAHHRYGEIKNFKGDYQEALHHFEKYLTWSVAAHDSSNIADALFGIGKVHKNLGNFEASLKSFYDVLNVCEKTRDIEGAAYARNSMGGIYRQMGKFEDALQHYVLANELYKSLNDQKNYAMGLQNMANVYSQMARYDSAKILYAQALEIIRSINKEYEEAIILGSLGNLHNKLDEHSVALRYHLQALPIKRRLANKRSLVFALHGVGYSYFKLGKLTEANIYLEEGLSLAKELQSKDLLWEIYMVLSQVAAAARDYERAYHYSTLSYQWNDSLLNEKNTRHINELEAKYESNKKEEEIKLLAKENELQQKELQRQALLKNTFIVGLVMVCILAVSIFYIARLKLNLAVKNTEVQEARFRQQLSELEMKALRSQINPHFLFNCMNSINRMILDGENDNASIYLAKFSKLMRLILENAETSKVSLQSELALLESYIQLESLRFKGRINYTITVDDQIDPTVRYLPSMVLQPFVENAIWHGLMHKNEGKGMLGIVVRENDGKLFCIIEDNGVGRDRARELSEESVLKSRSMGMRITEERLNLLSRERWAKLINIVDLKDSWDRALGTRVEISIPA